MNTCKCDNCSKNILIDLKEQDHGNGIIETYFTCGHCNQRYQITVSNSHIRKRIQYFAKEWAKMNQLKDGKEWDKKVWMRKYAKLQEYKAVTTQMIESLKQQIAEG